MLDALKINFFSLHLSHLKNFWIEFENSKKAGKKINHEFHELALIEAHGFTLINTDSIIATNLSSLKLRQGKQNKQK